MPEKRQETTIRDFLNVVFRRKWMILSIVALTTVIIVYLKASQPQLYASSSRILVRRGERVDVFSSRSTFLSWAEEVSSQIEVILSDAVFKRAKVIFADSLEARGMEGKLAFSGGKVRADVVGESSVFSIRYLAADPLEAQLGCEAMTMAYSRYYKEGKAPPGVEGYLIQEIERTAKDLELWRQKKETYLEEAQIFGVDRESQLRLVKLTNLETRLAETRGEVSSQELRVDNLRKHAEMSNEELEVSLSLSGSRNDLLTSMMVQIRQALQVERAKRGNLLNRYTARHPEVIACDRQIAELQSRLKIEVVNAYHVEQSQLAEIVAKVNSLESEVASARTAIDVLTEKEGELRKIDQQIATIQSKYELLLRKKNEAEIAIASTPEWEVTVLQPASKAWAQRTSDYVRLALGPFLSLIVALGLAFFVEGMDHSIKNSAEAEEYLGKPVLATFREIKDKKQKAA